MLADEGVTTVEIKSGYGLDLDTELASLRAVVAAGGVATWLGAHAVPPEFDDADAYPPGVLDTSGSRTLPCSSDTPQGYKFRSTGAGSPGPTGHTLLEGLSMQAQPAKENHHEASPTGRQPPFHF